jgi:isocitrate/isopropylmalate dehydrogenase
MSPSKSYSIASIPADGIGPEVVDAAIAVLKMLSQTLGSFGIDFTHYDWSSDTYKATGKYIPDGGLEQLKKHDAILFGAVGAPGKSSIRGIHGDISLTWNTRCAGPHFSLGS